MCIDNRAQRLLAKGSASKKSAHFHWTLKHIQEIVRLRLMDVDYVHTKHNPADIGSKPIGRATQFEHLRGLFLDVSNRKDPLAKSGFF